MTRRVGLLGFGSAGSIFHAPLIAATPGLELAAVVTADPDRGARVRAEHPGAEVVPDAARLWELDLDLVVVATPNRLHVPLAREAIGRGLAVVVDKPLAVRAEDACELVAVAGEAGSRLTVFQNRRWDGDFLTARRLLDDGILGAAVRFESRFERFRPEPKGGWRESEAPEEGGGQLLDLGSHLVDQARLLLGHPVRLYAEIDRRRPGARVEDDVFIALEHPGGARSHLWMGSAAPLHGPRLRLSGVRAGFACDGLDPQEAQLAAGQRPGAPGYGSREAGRLTHAGGSREQPIEDGRYQDFYAGVSAWLGGAAPAPVAPEDSVAVLELLEAARRSATMNSVIELPGTAATLG